MAALAIANAQTASSADLEVTSNTTTVDLDAYAGTTARIAPGVTVSNGITATTQAWDVTNNGTVNGGNVVRLEQGGTFRNSTGATVSGSGTAITFGYKNFGQPPAGGPGYLDNSGTIIGRVEGVTMWLGGEVINRAGAAISTATGLNAVSVGQGSSRQVTNAGTISATKVTGFSTGVLMQGGPAILTNTGSGTIFGDYNGVYASATTPLTFDNAGSISSRRGPAVEAVGGGTFINSGTIQSDSNGLFVAGSAAATVTNRGTIKSTGSGRAIVFSGGATHTLKLDTGSVLGGNVQGGSGTDNLVLLGTGAESIGKLLSFETLSMQGTHWTLSDAGSFSTGATVQSGTLQVNGTLTAPSFAIMSGGLLGGTGTIVGNVTNSGTIAPGNSIGTLNVIGNVAFATGSTYEVEVDPSGQNDKIGASGTATINGGMVKVLAATGTYAPNTTYTILTANGGRTGTFDAVTSNFAFLAPTLNYDTANVYLTLTRNGIDFASIGGTRNQRAAGSGVESLDFGNSIYDAVVQLDAAGARGAFDQLSGEIYASTMGILIDDSRFVRNATIDRLRAAFGSVGSSATPVAIYDRNGEPQAVAATTNRVAFWSEGFGSWGRTDGDGNAATLQRETGGVFVGGDGRLGDA